MTSPVDSLWHEIRNRFDRLPVWLPGTAMAVGDVGVFDDRGWSKRASLDELGIGFAVEAGGAPVEYDYSSSDGAEVDIRLRVPLDPVLDAVPVGNVGMRVRFSRRGAFVLKASEVSVSRIGDLAKVDEQILHRHAAGQWPREWVLISEVARGGPSVVLVAGSTEGGAVVDLGLAGATPGGRQLGAGCRLEKSTGLAASFIATTPTALLWRGRRVHHGRWGGRSRLVDRGTPGEAGALAADPGVVVGRAEVIDIEYPEDLPFREAGPGSGQ